MRDRAAVASWRLAIGGVAVVALGLLAIAAASAQGMALVPDGTILDGYDVGLLPWMDVGTWLVPVGGFVAAVAAAASIWLVPGRLGARLVSIPALVVVGFWLLLIALGTAPHNAVNGSNSWSSVATVVYSSPADTGLFLLVPMLVLVVVATVTRPRPARRSAGAAAPLSG